VSFYQLPRGTGGGTFNNHQMKAGDHSVLAIQLVGLPFRWPGSDNKASTFRRQSKIIIIQRLGDVL
jgi:hypothetical protein